MQPRRTFSTWVRGKLNEYGMKILISNKLLDEDVIYKLAENFCCTVQEIEMLFAKIARIESPFDLGDIKETVEKLQKYVIREETIFTDNIKDLFIDHSRESWHTHHKEGKPCKAKIKQPFWHRIRSFCVRKHYH